jgi:hypothetical protein
LVAILTKDRRPSSQALTPRLNRKPHSRSGWTSVSPRIPVLTRFQVSLGPSLRLGLEVRAQETAPNSTWRASRPRLDTRWDHEDAQPGCVSQQNRAPSALGVHEEVQLAPIGPSAIRSRRTRRSRCSACADPPGARTPTPAPSRQRDHTSRGQQRYHVSTSSPGRGNGWARPSRGDEPRRRGPRQRRNLALAPLRIAAAPFPQAARARVLS